jgi:hypothetical protein
MSGFTGAADAGCCTTYNFPLITGDFGVGRHLANSFSVTLSQKKPTLSGNTFLISDLATT